MLQKSRFNHITYIENEGYLLYNFMTGALVVLDEDTKRRFDSIEKLTSEEFSLCIDNGFIVDDFDELEYLKFGNKLTCSNSDLLSILIAPTMACNFDCPYCFEHHGSGIMSEAVQNAIIEFIENSLIANNHKHLFVYWFGGEPLLAIETIEKMSERIQVLVDKYKIGFSSSMSTNGYFLNQEVIDILEKAKLNRVQITLDGMKVTNDKTRRLKDGSGSFDRIVNNLKGIKTNITIHIRSNINKSNETEFKELNELISSIRKENEIDISLYGAHMSVYDFNNEKVDDMELTMKEFSEVLKKNNILGGSRFHNIRFMFCDAASAYSFCFDNNGDMYKCWNDIGNTKFKYDNVFNANLCGVNFINKNALNFLANSFPEDSKCLECKVLPICMGGCIKKRVIEGRNSCSPVVYNLDDYVYKKFLNTQGGEFNEIGN